jgi:hypothetical protein
VAEVPECSDPRVRMGIDGIDQRPVHIEHNATGRHAVMP